jgi:hypothetical protein
MATIDKTSAENMTDLDYAIHLIMTGKKDPEFEARVHAEADEIREKIFQKHGLLDIAVDLIREGRDEE